MKLLIRGLYSLYVSIQNLLHDIKNTVSKFGIVLTVGTTVLVGLALAFATAFFYPRVFSFHFMFVFLISFGLLTALLLSVIFFIALDRFAETLGVLLQHNVALKNSLSSVTVASQKVENSVDRGNSVMRNMIGALEKNGQLLQDFKRQLDSPEEHPLSPIKTHRHP